MAMNQNMPMDPNMQADSGAQMDPNVSMPTPEGLPGGAEQLPEQDMASPEEMQTLWDMMNQIEQKYQEMNAEGFAGGNKIESQKRELIAEVFQALQDAGVDTTNIDEVRQFLDELQQSNPDLYELFDSAFSDLLGGETSPGAGTEETAPEAAALGETPAGSEPTPSDSGSAVNSDTGILPSGGAIPSGVVPSNAGLSGMTPPANVPGISGRFPNLAQ
jgi:hypothetical protein